MKIRLIGLGKMGSNFAYNLKDRGYEVIGFDTFDKAREELKNDILIEDSMKKVLVDDGMRKIIWLFVPSQIVDKIIEDMLPYLNKKDIVIDAGNSNFNISIRRYHYLKSRGIDFVDVGSSGGIDGARHGLTLMVGADVEVYQYLKPFLENVSVENGCAHVGRPGSGHFVKMVHNGIEYGMMQSIAEGFNLLEASAFEFDYKQISKMWNHGSLIESTLLKKLEQTFDKDQKLTGIEGRIDDSGEAMWMVEEALRYKVSIPVIAQSLFVRYKSRDDDNFSEKLVASMRKEFGGHAVHKKK